MRKPGENTREIRFFSKKNQLLVKVYSQDTRMYSRYLEEMGVVKSYEANKPLSRERVWQIQSVDLRKAYIEQEWESDFYLTMTDGTNAVREVVRPSDLNKRAVIEQLELSRRYWKSIGVIDWKIVCIGRMETCS